MIKALHYLVCHALTLHTCWKHRPGPPGSCSTAPVHHSHLACTRPPALSKFSPFNGDSPRFSPLVITDKHNHSILKTHVFITTHQFLSLKISNLRPWTVSQSSTKSLINIYSLWSQSVWDTLLLQARARSFQCNYYHCHDDKRTAASLGIVMMIITLIGTCCSRNCAEHSGGFRLHLHT